MEQTKGYLKLRGKVWGLNNKEAKENDTKTKRWLSFGLQTSKDNSLFVQIGEWANTTLNVKIKGEGMESVEEINEQIAIDRVKEIFKDGDSIFVNLRANVDTFRKSITFIANQIYIEKEPIDFDSEDFEETNELNQSVIVIEKPQDRKVKVGVTTYKGEMIEQELRLNDDDVNDYFEENVKVGDLMKLSIRVNNTPNYVDGDNNEPTKARKTLKGKTIEGGNKKRTIDGYTEFLEVTDVDLDKIVKKKYEKSEIREALKLTENNQSKYVKKEEDKTNDSDSKIDDDSLPF